MHFRTSQRNKYVDCGSGRVARVRETSTSKYETMMYFRKAKKNVEKRKRLVIPFEAVAASLAFAAAAVSDMVNHFLDFGFVSFLL